MKLQIDMKFTNVLVMSKADTNRMLKQELHKLGRFYHANYAKKHYTRAGAREYNYTPRSRKYNYAKQRLLKHSIPLVFTGRTRELAKSKNVRATRKWVQVTMPIRAVNFKPRNSRVNMREEVERVSENERKTIQDRFNTKMEGRIRSFVRQKTRRA